MDIHYIICVCFFMCTLINIIFSHNKKTDCQDLDSRWSYIISKEISAYVDRYCMIYLINLDMCKNVLCFISPVCDKDGFLLSLAEIYHLCHSLGFVFFTH